MSEQYPLTVFKDNQPVTIYDEQEWNCFVQNYTLIHAAGGLVSNENDEILMIFRLGCWDFPKGKVEEGEDWPTAAVREVEEETGLRNILLKEAFVNTYHTYILKDTPILKITHWYSMQAHSQSLVPQTEEDIAQAVWVPVAEVSSRLKESYLSLRELWGRMRGLED